MQINLFSLKALTFIYALGLFIVLASALPIQNDHHPLFFDDHLCTGCNVDVPVEGHGCEVCWQRSAQAAAHYPGLRSPPLNTLVPEEQRGTGPLTLPHYQPEHYVTDTSESLNSLPSPNLPHELGAERHTGHPPISQPEGTPSQSPSTASQIPQPSPHQQHNKPSVHSSPQPSAMGAPSSSSPKSDFLTTPQLSTGIPSQHQAPPPLPGPPGNHGRRQRPRRFIQTADGQMLPSATVNSQNRRIANYFFQDYVNIAEEFKGYNLSHPEVNSAALQKVEKEFMKPGKAKRIDYERIARVAKQTGIQLRKPFELGSRTGPSSTQWKPTE